MITTIRNKFCQFNTLGEVILPPKSNNMKLFLRGLEFPPNEDLPWKFNFCWFDQKACQLIDNSNRFADNEWSDLEKLTVWDTNKLVNEDNQPIFPPEDAVLSVCSNNNELFEKFIGQFRLNKKFWTTIMLSFKRLCIRFRLTITRSYRRNQHHKQRWRFGYSIQLLWRSHHMWMNSTF